MEPSHPTPSPSPQDWSHPKPEVIAKPSWWPAALAMGATLFFWGLVTSLFVLIAGLVAFAISLAGWIGEIRHEHTES